MSPVKERGKILTELAGKPGAMEHKKKKLRPALTALKGTLLLVHRSKTHHLLLRLE
jgi:hypothetical protein